jgi:hypothetical protein
MEQPGFTCNQGRIHEHFQIMEGASGDNTRECPSWKLASEEACDSCPNARMGER